MTMEEQARLAKNAYCREKNSTLTEEQRQKRRQYMREWNRRNPDKRRATMMRYWAKKYAQSIEGSEGGGANE